jgi:hypothetical protein
LIQPQLKAGFYQGERTLWWRFGNRLFEFTQDLHAAADRLGSEKSVARRWALM